MTIHYVHLVENIFGRDIRALKVNSTRNKTKLVKYDVVEILTELIEQKKDLTHCMNIMFLNDISMLPEIDRTIRYQYMV